MKAIIVQSPNNLQIKEIPEPKISDYECLCKMLACSVCSGTDNHLLEGDKIHTQKYGAKYPLILGHEGIGRIIKCGKKVRNFKEGDLVTRVINKQPAKNNYFVQHGHGSFAEKGIISDWQAMKKNGVKKEIWNKYTFNRTLPKNFDPVESTMIITWRETYSFLKRIRADKKEKIIIIGSGANALAFTEHAKNLNLKTAIIGNPKRKKDFKKVGIKKFISYKTDKQEKLLAKNGFSETDIIIDAIGKSDSLNKILPLLKDGGKIGIYGLDELLDYKIDITKTKGDFKYYSGQIYNEGLTHNEIINFIKRKQLNPWNYISKKHIYPLSQIKKALDATKTRKALKSVIDFSL